MNWFISSGRRTWGWVVLSLKGRYFIQQINHYSDTFQATAVRVKSLRINGGECGAGWLDCALFD
jgi:hypothetical protein